MKRSNFKWLHYFLGFTFLSLGVIGVFLPLIPTTPFILLALYFFSKSSEKWSSWILQHPIYGPPIQRWKAKHAITTKVKITALGMLTFSFSLSLYFTSDRIYLCAGLLGIFTILLFFILRLPVNDEPLKANPKNRGVE